MKPAYKKLEFGSFAEIEVYKAFSSLIGSDETIEREGEPEAITLTLCSLMDVKD